MNPELKRYLPAVYIIGGAILLILLISWIISPKFSSYKLYKTPFSDSHFVSLQDNRVYAYNKAAFYSVNPKDPKDISVLSSGVRLPEVKKLYWAGDDGALMIFGAAQSDASEVETELAAMGLTYNTTTTDYVWYLDFKTNKLSLVSTTLLSSENAYYSKTEKGFYYTAYDAHHQHGDDEEEVSPLSFFDTSTKKVRPIISNIGHDKVNYIGECPSNKVCVIQGTDNNKQELWSIEGSTKKTLINNYDHISPTNNPSLFLGEKNQPIESDHEMEDIQLQAETFLVDVSSNKTTPAGTLVNVGGTIIANTSGDGKKLSIIDDSLRAEGDVSVYLATAPDIFGTMKSKQVPFVVEDGEELTESIVASTSKSPDGVDVLTGANHNVYLMGPSSYSFKSDKYDNGKLASTLKPCFDKYTKYHKYSGEISEMVVGITFDDSFRKNVAGFSSCITETDKTALVGQTYTFVGLSPIDGRFVTN